MEFLQIFNVANVKRLFRNPVKKGKTKLDSKHGIPLEVLYF